MSYQDLEPSGFAQGTLAHLNKENGISMKIISHRCFHVEIQIADHYDYDVTTK